MVLEIRFSVSEEKARFLRSRLVILREFTRTFPLFLQLFSLNNSSANELRIYKISAIFV